MIGKLSVSNSHCFTATYLVKVLKAEKWLIINQETESQSALFRSIYLPELENIVVTTEAVDFLYGQEYYRIEKEESLFFRYFVKLLLKKYN